MVYLNTFDFAQSERHAYPHRFLMSKGIGRLYFNPITIFYGSNGSGKLTALNVIARAIGVQKMTLGNENEFFKSYLEGCSFEMVAKPKDVSFIRSEDSDLNGVYYCFRIACLSKANVRINQKLIRILQL